MSLLLTAIPEQTMLGQTVGRIGNQDRYVSPGHVYRSGDGRWIKLVGGGDAIFPRLAAAMGVPDLVTDPRFATLSARIDNRADIDAIIEGWLLARTADDALALLDRHGVPAALVATAAELVTNSQVQHRGSLATFDHPAAGRMTMQGVPIKLSETPGSIRRPPPLLGEHTDTVLAEWLGKPGNVATMQ
jgi:crotonobetainyl-CoA:carnitine CoA-transferase CaiB-like acyl-CoA transferase